MNLSRLSALVLGITLGAGASSEGQDAPPAFKALTTALSGAAPAGQAFQPGGRVDLSPHDHQSGKPDPRGRGKLRVMVWPNETLAQAIARTVHESGQMSRYWVNVQNQDGVIDLFGEVSNEAQRDVVIWIARSAPGVVMVRDYLQLHAENPVAQMQVLQPLPTPLPLPTPQPLPGGMEDKGIKIPDRLDGQLPEPTPIFQMPTGPNPSMQPPPLPPYAWPTFAPYNNYSRVAYPLAYSYEQWPFIGPMYPFPRVPLGWRSVSLTWEDGHWWFHRNPTGADWWRIRYW